MKKRWLFLLTLIITLGIFSMSVFAADPDVTFSTSAPPSVEIGDTFQVEVISAEIKDAYSVAVKLTFDNSVFEVTDIQWNKAIPMAATTDIVTANTKGAFAGNYVDNEWNYELVIPKNSTFVTATFKVKESAAVGASIIKLEDFKPYDMLSSPIDVNISSSTLTINIVPPAIYAFDVLVGSEVEKVYEVGEEDDVYTYSVCNGLLVYVAEDDPEQAVTMSFTSGENGDSGVYDVILDVAQPGDGYSYLEFVFTELPTVPSVISLTEGAGFSLDESGDDEYNSKPTGDGTDYVSLYQGFGFNGLTEGGELQAKFLATLPRSDGDPVERIINLTVRHVDPLALLEEAIAAAKENKDSVGESEDGYDVNPSDQWVKPEVMSAYADAIAAAQEVANKEEPDLDEVNQAIVALNAATAAFNDAKKDGEAVYAFDVLVGSEVEKVYEVGEEDDVYTYSVCNGLLVYVAEDDPEQAVTMSFTSGENGDSGVYDVILDVAQPGDGYSYLEFVFTELPTVPSVISLTEGAGFSLDESGDDEYNSKPTGDGTDYVSLYQGFGFNGLTEGGELQAKFLATLPRSDGDPVERTINLTVRHNPELLNPHTVTISGGGSGASGAGDYYKGETVNINAGNRSGYTFTGWTSDEVTITNASNKNASFIMPAKAVTVTANWKSSGSSSSGGGGAVAPTVTGIEIKSAPDKVSYDEGDKLDLTGLEVTVTYSDGKTKDIAAEDFAKNGITVSPKAGEVLDADVTAIEIKADGKTVKQVIVVDKKDIVTPQDIDKPVEKPVLTDIDGHWAEDYIDYLVGIGAISGYPDGTFRPDAPITRAEFAKVIVDAFELKGSGKVFDDTADHWAKNYVAIAAANGIVLGYNENEFGPDDLITREQMAIIIVKAAGLKEQTGVLDFIDEGNVSSWAYNWVVSAVDNNLMSGYEDNSFKPLNNATRAEAATVIYNILMK